MAPYLLGIISALLFYIAYIEHRHQLFVERITQPPQLPRQRPLTPPAGLPRPLTREELLGALEPRHMPFLLERPAGPELWEVAPTREWHRFESYGVDVSVCPTICVD